MMDDATGANRLHAFACAGEILAKADAVMAGQFGVHDLFAPGPQIPSVATRQHSLTEGRPLFDSDDWPVNPQAPARVLAVVREAWEQALSHCGKYGTLFDTCPALSDASSLVHWALEGHAPVPKDQGAVDEIGDAFPLVAMLVARPFLRSAAKALLMDLSLNQWRHRECPMRGYPPAMAVLVGDVRERRLWCQWCDTCWDVGRLGCVFCGNQDAGALRYFETDPPSALRIDVCECCKRYIKTCDGRQMSPEIPLGLLRMELTSSGLDAAVSKLGFSPPRTVG